MHRLLLSVLAILFAGVVSMPASGDVLVFENVAGPFNGPVENDPTATSLIGFEDYIGDTSNINPGLQQLTEFQFVGGLTDNGDPVADTGTIAFSFFDTGGNFVDGLSATIGEGYFIYTFTIPFEFKVQTSGFMQVDMFTDGTFTTPAMGGWFHTTTAPSVGSSPGTAGGAPAGENFMFSLTMIPEPASAGLIGLAMIGVCGFMRRRRR